MTTQDLDNITAQIEAINVCSELQAFKNDIINLANAQAQVFATQLARLVLLSNPVTFIAAYVKMVQDDIVALKRSQAQIASDIAILTNAINSRAGTIGCTLT